MQGDKSRQILEGGPQPLHWTVPGTIRNGLQWGLLTLVFIYLYSPAIAALASTWWVRDDYSFGVLVPLISLYLIWLRRERLKHLPIRPAYPAGMAAVLSACAMLLLGRAGSVMILQELSLVAMIPGLVLYLLGKDYLKALSFPIAYLLFMVPIADELIAPLHWSFQLLTAKMGVAMLQSLGFTALLEQQYITLPSITLEVAKVCSGINYLISIIALGVPLAYVTQKNSWCRVVLVAAAVIIGVIGNWVRVAAIGIWAYYGGQVVHGPFHVFQALFVSQIGFVALFAGAWILAKVPAAPSNRAVVGGQAGDGGRGTGNRGRGSGAWEDRGIETGRRRLDRSWWSAFLVLLVLAAYFSFQQRGPVPLKAEFSLFPMTIGNWRAEIGGQGSGVGGQGSGAGGQGTGVGGQGLGAGGQGTGDGGQGSGFWDQGADHELMRVYRNPSGHEIRLYVAYFESQHHPKKLVNYRTARLHHDAVAVDIQISRNASIAVNEFRIPNDRGGQPAYFWYDINGKTRTGRYGAMLANALNAMIHGRTNGALIMVSGVGTDPENGETIFEEEQAFVRELVPVLRWYLP